MNRTEIVKALELEILKQSKQVKLIKKVLKIDVSKFEGKVINKRVQTHLLNELEKQVSNTYIYVRFDKYYSWYNLIVDLKPTDDYYNNTEIDITMTDMRDVDMFSVELFKKPLEKKITHLESNIKMFKQEVRTITTRIKKYNKIVDDIKAFEDNASYKLKELMKTKYSNRPYDYKIFIESEVK